MGALFGTTIDASSPVFAVLDDDAAIAAQAVELILDTARGSLWSSPESGFDLAGLINRGITRDELAIVGRQVENAITYDPRFARCDVTPGITYLASGAVALKLEIVVYPRGAEDVPIALTGVASAELVRVTTRGI